MLKNYVTIALRTMRRHPGYVGINVAGLAIGMASCLLILTFARSEWSFDAFHKDADNIYRVNIRAVTPGGDVQLKAGVPVPLAPQLPESFSEVAASARVLDGGEANVRSGATTGTMTVRYSDPAFFDVFTFSVTDGVASDALAAPENAVLTESAALRLTGPGPATGRLFQVLMGDQWREFTVAAVMADPPPTSSIIFDILLPTTAYPGVARYADTWTNWMTNTFIRLQPGVDPAAIESRFPAFVTQYFGPMTQTWKILKWIGEDPGDFTLTLQPLADVHFSPEIEQSIATSTDPRYPGFLLGLALAILLIASINFTTLSVGRASRRAREVGLRKMLGAPRLQLMRQFWGEALIMSAMALLLGLALTEVLAGRFGDLMGRSLTMAYDPFMILTLAGIVMVTALLAGTYPALYVSSFRPAHILKGARTRSGGNRWMQALVVLQFTLSIGFIMSVFVVSDQLEFLRTKDLGFDKEAVVIVETFASTPEEGDRVASALRTAWSALPDVSGVAASSSGFNRFLSWGAFGSADGEAHTVYTNRVDRAFADVLGLRIQEGQLFSEAFPSDSAQAILVNEALVREFGWDDPIGQPVNNYGTVAGVVEDYHFRSLHEQVEPMVLMLTSRNQDPYRYLYVRLDDAAAVATLQSAWTAVQPDAPFTWYFLDDDLNAAYASEQQTARIMSAAAGLAVIIACLGLLGLAAYAAETRTREIGIRKVVGASTASIVRLLSLDFLKLVVVAIVLSVPLAWFVMERWLDGFAYRMDPDWTVALWSATLALAIALGTVATQAIRAALADPVASLRHD